MATVAKGSSGGRSGGAKASAPKSSSSASKPASSSKTPTNSKYSSKGGVVGDGYTPKFKNGYTAPPGSTVYYANHGPTGWDLLPWIYILGHDGSQEATVVQPDGTEVKTVEEGADGLYYFNWFMMILIIGALIAGIVWGVYKWSNRRR